MNIFDALKSQPKLALESGYKLWIENDDENALKEALEIWGFSIDDEGEIS